MRSTIRKLDRWSALALAALAAAPAAGRSAAADEPAREVAGPGEGSPGAPPGGDDPGRPPPGEGDPFGDLGTPGAAPIPFPSPSPRRAPLPHYEFLEDAYLNYFLPNVGPAGDAPLAFEAQVAPHLFLLNQWEKVQWQPLWNGGWVHSLAVTFLLRLRMVTDRSAPVRPPSYVPRIDYQAFRVWKTRSDAVHLLELRATPWAHHSNGQQFCPFVEGDPGGIPGSVACAPVDPADPPIDEVNYRSGDFSTSFFVVGGHWALLRLDGDRRERSRLAAGLLLEGNPRPWGPGSIGALTSELYGPWRLRLDVEARRRLDAPFGAPALAGTLSGAASVELMWKTAPGIPGDREILEASYLPDQLHGAGVFVRLFTGQDWMNILFAAGRTTMVQFGVVWSLSPPLQYTFQPPGA